MYDLPPESIAQIGVEPRDASRLMLAHADGHLSHRHFYDVIDCLNAGDVLVVNDTRVLPARLLGVREGGGAAELLLLRRLERDVWEALARPGRKLHPGARIIFGDGALVATIQRETPERRAPEGGRIVSFAYEGAFEALLDRLGVMPLPPYITQQLEDPNRYQTVYAREHGSAAAPTAGLHFTPELLARIAQKGITTAPIVLHVGLGTFRPVQAEDVSEHIMHEEWYSVSEASAAAINAARSVGGRIVCVGTTCVRTLESAADDDGAVRAQSGFTRIFITPGYRFKAVDALITNFHLPGSTLLMLVSAFMGRHGAEPDAGRKKALAAYREAVAQGYRFYSLGDAMFIE